MFKTIAVFGAGPGMGRAVARRFGREGFQVALVARNQDRLDAFTGGLTADGIEAAGLAGDIADRDALPGMIEAITARFGPIDVLEYAPSGLDLLNLATAAAAARHYLHTLHTDLAGTGVYAGLLQISGPVGDSDAGNFVLETYGAANLPEPQKPADLADAM